MLSTQQLKKTTCQGHYYFAIFREPGSQEAAMGRVTFKNTLPAMPSKDGEATTSYKSPVVTHLPQSWRQILGGLLQDSSVTCMPAQKQPKAPGRWPPSPLHFPKLFRCFLLVEPNLFSYASCKGSEEGRF